MSSNEGDTARTDGGNEYVEGVEESVQDDPLVVLFGDHAKARMLMALLDAHPRTLNPADIVDNAGLGSRQTWYNNKDDLLETGLVGETGSAGNSPLYGLVDDDRVEWLENLRSATAAELRESSSE